MEPKHATLVRIVDRQGKERNNVFTEVEDESGKQMKVFVSGRSKPIPLCG